MDRRSPWARRLTVSPTRVASLKFPPMKGTSFTAATLTKSWNPTDPNSRRDGAGLIRFPVLQHRHDLGPVEPLEDERARGDPSIAEL